MRMNDSAHKPMPRLDTAETAVFSPNRAPYDSPGHPSPNGALPWAGESCPVGAEERMNPNREGVGYGG